MLAAPAHAHAGNVTVKEGETARFQVTVTTKWGDGVSTISTNDPVRGL